MKELDAFNLYKPVLQRCSLFSDIAQELYCDSLKFMKAQLRTYFRDEYILHIGEPFRYGIVLLSGSVEGSFITENYDKVNMNHFEPGALIGESLACAEEKSSPIQLRALSETVVLLLDFTVLYRTDSVKYSYQLKLLMNLMKNLSRQNVFLSGKIRILSQKTHRDKLMMYLESLPKGADGTVRLPYSKTALAEFLGVNRSALSREIGNMVNEGLIEVEGRVIRVLN